MQSMRSSKLLSTSGTCGYSRGSYLAERLIFVLDWAELHREELLNDWNLCRAKEAPKPIAPLL
jgi:hypothetical protein